MKQMISVIGIALGLGMAGQAMACGIEGMVTWSDGSKSDGTSTISTSWNGTKAFPKDGRYQLDLGSSACGEKITVYVNGNQGKEVRVTGSTVVNFTLR
jgi:hypothetical protein